MLAACYYSPPRLRVCQLGSRRPRLVRAPHPHKLKPGLARACSRWASSRRSRVRSSSGGATEAGAATAAAHTATRARSPHTATRGGSHGARTAAAHGGGGARRTRARGGWRAHAAHTAHPGARRRSGRRATPTQAVSIARATPALTTPTRPQRSRRRSGAPRRVSRPPRGGPRVGRDAARRRERDRQRAIHARS